MRQQWNFSPPTTVDEHEDYGVELSGATALELTINPDISRSDSHPSLRPLSSCWLLELDPSSFILSHPVQASLICNDLNFDSADTGDESPPLFIDM